MILNCRSDSLGRLGRDMCVSVCAKNRPRPTHGKQKLELAANSFFCHVPFRTRKNFGELINSYSPSPPPPFLVHAVFPLRVCVRVQVKTFFEENPVPNSARKLSQMLESMGINVRFFKTIADSPLSTDSFWEGLEM